MLDVRVTIEGDRLTVANLAALAERFPKAVERGLKRIAQGVHRQAFDRLSGPGRALMRLTNRAAVITEAKINSKGKISIKQRSRSRGQFDLLGAKPGSYPVPIQTGNLIRLLDFLYPGEGKSGPAGTFTAGPMEVVVFNSAAYARAIHDGTGSSSGFGPRPFLVDGLKMFNEGSRIKAVIEEEINREIAMRGV